MKKITRVGWVSCEEDPLIQIDANSKAYKFLGIYATKGKKSDLIESWWPPRKVRITVEEVK